MFFRTYSGHSKNRILLNIAPIPLLKYGKKSLLWLCVPGKCLVCEIVNNIVLLVKSYFGITRI